MQSVANPTTEGGECLDAAPSQIGDHSALEEHSFGKGAYGLNGVKAGGWSPCNRLFIRQETLQLG